MIIPGGLELNAHDTGQGAPLVLLHALGMDMRLWDRVVPLLPPGLRVIRVDLRGHGASPAPDGDYFMGDLVADVAGVLDRLAVREAVVCGISLGGMIAQGLAAERLDQVRALVLSNTAPKIGVPQMWRDRIETVRQGGIESVADATLQKWFAPAFRKTDTAAEIRARLVASPVQGYAGCCAAIAETDLFDSTARLRLPTLAIAGSADGSTPPDLVREAGALIPGSKFQMIRGAGHLPCVDKPTEYAETLGRFLQEIGHV